MTAQHLLRFAIATKLSGDRTRVLELFQDESFYSLLAAAPHGDDDMFFSDGNGDGFYFLATELGYNVLYKERGYVCIRYGRFADIADAATSFFSVTGYIAPRDVSERDLGPLPGAPVETPMTSADFIKGIGLALLCGAVVLIILAPWGVALDRLMAR